jgi:diaminopropionate ammonia-lyase
VERIVVNRLRGGVPEAPSTLALSFHRKLPGYEPTPLRDAAPLAKMLGLEHVWVKDEASRFGLPSFKYLGASWAVARLLRETQPERLRAAADRMGVRRLVAATDGNHGRAVARVAREIGLDATIYVPSGMVSARRRAIVDEGAAVIDAPGEYDTAVRLATDAAADAAVRVINDADQEGRSPVPGWVIEGYSTLFLEAQGQLAAGGVGVDLVVLQLGVGAFAAAGVRWAAPHGVRPVGAEPVGAPCVAFSLANGAPQTVETTGTLMAGLDCQTPSRAAWTTLAAGLLGVVLLEDSEADDATRLLARAGIESGESGAAGVAGLNALARDAECALLRDSLSWDAVRSVLVVNTEGATDPERYQKVVGRTA